MNFAGFWIRVLAYIIDIIPLAAIGFILALVTGEPLVELTRQRQFTGSVISSR